MMDAAEIHEARRMMALSIGLLADCLAIDKRLVERFETGRATPSPPIAAFMRVLRDVPSALDYRLNEVQP